ncbi:lef-5 [Cotesia congregata filamentous virus 1]|uniref:Lef-5 n=1 Tax=Cotesia congregata filamentous virus 1 TaxID=3064291 RepID=A0ABC8QR00_9VIRU|nr:lef-5 [Cotesia congregata filamentous virus 1]
MERNEDILSDLINLFFDGEYKKFIQFITAAAEIHKYDALCGKTAEEIFSKLSTTYNRPAQPSAAPPKAHAKEVTEDEEPQLDQMTLTDLEKRKNELKKKLTTEKKKSSLDKKRKKDMVTTTKKPGKKRRSSSEESSSGCDGVGGGSGDEKEAIKAANIKEIARELLESPAPIDVGCAHKFIALTSDQKRSGDELESVYYMCAHCKYVRP